DGRVLSEGRPATNLAAEKQSHGALGFRGLDPACRSVGHPHAATFLEFPSISRRYHERPMRRGYIARLPHLVAAAGCFLLAAEPGSDQRTVSGEAAFPALHQCGRSLGHPGSAAATGAAAGPGSEAPGPAPNSEAGGFSG